MAAVEGSTQDRNGCAVQNGHIRVLPPRRHGAGEEDRQMQMGMETQGQQGRVYRTV